MITGCHGLLGQKVVSLLTGETKYEILTTDISNITFLSFPGSEKCDYTQLDITAKSDVKSLVGNYGPDVIINTAAYNNVDDSETEREFAWKINVDGVKNLIIAARKTNSQIVHISSDYIFDGKTAPYSEDSRPNPLSYYGKTKLASENALRMSGARYAIIRSMILYGYGKNVRQNFALWVINEINNQRPILVVDDQIGSPTLVDDLAYGILRVVELNRDGIYHISGSETLSRYEFALKIAGVFGLNPKLIRPVKTADLERLAHRPLQSSFITLKAETDLGIKTVGVEEGLLILKRQLANAYGIDLKTEIRNHRLGYRT
jgi:dTDP-4-dehydrorhamnose reductase